MSIFYVLITTFWQFQFVTKILLTFSGICAINFVLILRQYTSINRQAISISQKAKWKIKRLSSINIHCYYNILRDGQQFVLSTPTPTQTQTPQSKVYWHLSLYSNINWTRGQKGEQQRIGDLQRQLCNQKQESQQ